jgi:HEPN domain-containing protein
MLRKESNYPADWMRIAEKDLARVGWLLDNRDPEMAGFCLQQAVEKFLKAFLLSKGWQLRRIHNLDALLDDTVAYEPSLEKFRHVCQKITAFYFGALPFCDGQRPDGKRRPRVFGASW